MVFSSVVCFAATKIFKILNSYTAMGHLANGGVWCNLSWTTTCLSSTQWQAEWCGGISKPSCAVRRAVGNNRAAGLQECQHVCWR
uniref:Uncharacterized protein n=1 Tax=Triticum urartu TaxID=4572 RepID=A0A8R7K290_TRIUA